MSILEMSELEMSELEMSELEMSELEVLYLLDTTITYPCQCALAV